MVFYRSPELVITDRLFVIRGRPVVRYAVCHLRNVHVVRSEFRHAGRAAPRYLGAWAIVLIFAAILLDSQVVLALALLTLGISAALVRWFSATRRRWELRAHHLGNEVCLFASSDERTFGQVRRAIVRALETLEDR